MSLRVADAPEVRVVTPFPAHAVPRIWLWMQPFLDRIMDDAGPKTMAEFMREWERRKQITWGIYCGGELCGMISYEPKIPTFGTTHYLFKKDFRGHGMKQAATRLVLGELFRRGVEKIGATPFTDNHAIISFLKEIGFKEEAILLKQTSRYGKLADVLMVGLTQKDFEEAKHAMGSDRVNRSERPEFVPGEPRIEEHDDHRAQPESGVATAPGPVSREHRVSA